MRYLVQFPAGSTALVRSALAAYLTKVTVEHADDSALLLRAHEQLTNAQQLPIVKTVYRVVAKTPRQEIDRSVLSLAKSARTLPPAAVPSTGFRVMYQIDGALVAVAAGARSALERRLAQLTGLRVTPRGDCREYWVIGRRTLPDLYLTEKLPSMHRRKTAKGRLADEVCALLVAASTPTPRDRFVDPFAGTGAIVQARLAQPARRLIYNDLHAENFGEATASLARQGVTVLAEDALRLASLPDNSIDVIVTDPPWGEFDAPGAAPFPQFLAGVAATFRRILSEKGRFVVLITRREADALSEALTSQGLSVRSVVEVLINGHPASVLIGARNHRAAR